MVVGVALNSPGPQNQRRYMCTQVPRGKQICCSSPFTGHCTLLAIMVNFKVRCFNPLFLVQFPLAIPTYLYFPGSPGSPAWSVDRGFLRRSPPRERA